MTYMPESLAAQVRASRHPLLWAVRVRWADREFRETVYIALYIAGSAAVVWRFA